ncbi:hypothetical protein, partial [Nostoc sp. NMS4]|uniref:hypothetical protein n=1 Tax=Nostoc sp. NMS4 TaxID=2815390 RepID=UPI0025E99AE9
MHAKDNKPASQNHQTPKDNSSWLKPRPFAPSPKEATQISTTPEEIKHQKTANVTRRTNLLEILTLSTENEHNVIQRMPKKKKLKNQEVPETSEQGTVNEGEQVAPQTTTAALPTAEIEQEQTEET